MILNSYDPCPDVFFVPTYYLLLTTQALAQQGIEVTTVYDIKEEAAVDGDIVIASAEGVVLSTRPYDKRLFGVIQSQPLLSLKRVDGTGKPVSRNGIALVNVTTINGPIKTGDSITSSETPGKGQKATLSGYIIGTALKDFDESAATKINIAGKEILTGKLPVALRMEFAELTNSRSLNRSFDYINNYFLQNVQDPEKTVQVVRYFAAILSIIISFLIGFIAFSRSIPKGIEAIGRNPLAANAIRFSIILNIAFTIITASIGIIAAVLILRL
ncbi:MAG: hypothetical protein Q7S88_00415 [Candidatus Daviesbacteria bacterium]|nr:hypothetical protein [Candidatus Daviesbacteria bacterium]